MRTGSRKLRQVVVSTFDQRLALSATPALDLSLESEGFINAIALLMPHKFDRSTLGGVRIRVPQRMLLEPII